MMITKNKTFTRQCVAVDSLKLKTTDQLTQNAIAMDIKPATMLHKVVKRTRNRVELSFAIFMQLKSASLFFICESY